MGDDFFDRVDGGADTDRVTTPLATGRHTRRNHEEIKPSRFSSRFSSFTVFF